MEDAKNVYLAIKGDVVVHHTDLSAMLEMDGIEKADMTITSEKFEAIEGLARVIEGKIFLGKTENEKKIKANNTRIAEIDKILTLIDAESARSSRAVSYAFATSSTPDKKDVEKVKEYEEKSIKLRSEREKLVKKNENLVS